MFSQRFAFLPHLPRVFVGCLLIATGLGKLLDIPGFVAILSHYQLGPFPIIYPLIGYTLPFIELGIGLALLLAFQERLASWAAIILHVGFVGMLTTTLLRGIPISVCGCFGVFLPRPLTWGSVLEDVVMLAVSILCLLVWNWRQRTIDTE